MSSDLKSVPYFLNQEDVNLDKVIGYPAKRSRKRLEEEMLKIAAYIRNSL